MLVFMRFKYSFDSPKSRIFHHYRFIFLMKTCRFQIKTSSQCLFTCQVNALNQLRVKSCNLLLLPFNIHFRVCFFYIVLLLFIQRRFIIRGVVHNKNKIYCEMTSFLPSSTIMLSH